MACGWTYTWRDRAHDHAWGAYRDFRYLRSAALAFLQVLTELAWYALWGDDRRYLVLIGHPPDPYLRQRFQAHAFEMRRMARHMRELSAGSPRRIA